METFIPLASVGGHEVWTALLAVSYDTYLEQVQGK